jgi:hypothetical protein
MEKDDEEIEHSGPSESATALNWLSEYRHVNRTVVTAKGLMEDVPGKTRREKVRYPHISVK